MKTMKMLRFALVLLGIATMSARAQPALAFEVASVKPSPPRAGTAGAAREISAKLGNHRLAELR
jgi:hypothetical protein